MSPTQTDPGPPGARASTSVGASDQCVTPTVAPERSTTKTRPVSPESLVVTNRSSCTTSALASTIAGSLKVRTVAPRGALGATASPIENGMATSSPISVLGIQELVQPRPDPPRRHQVVVLLARGAGGRRPPRAHRPQQRV